METVLLILGAAAVGYGFTAILLIYLESRGK